MKMLKRKAAIQGILCAIWLILNWLRPGLLSAGVLCAVLTAQIVIQDYIEEKRWASLKKGWRAGAAFAAGAILTAITTILLSSEIEAGQALLSDRDALAFGLAGTFCITALFLEDSPKNQKAAGCVIFTVMLALCTALMRTSQGKNVLSFAFMQKDTVFAPRMRTLYGLVVLPCLQAVLVRICRCPEAGENRRAIHLAAVLAAAIWLALALPLVVFCFSQTTGIVPAGSPIWIWSRLPALPLELLFAAVWLAGGTHESRKKEKSA